jgi:succinoglycan biosynthesis protein ExoA
VTATSETPVVTVVVPMLNEREAIGHCLDTLARQTHPTSHLDVVVVDGGSTDGSREVVIERSMSEPWIRLVENPDRRASSAFNRGIDAAKGDFVCLVSAHGEVERDYVSRSLAVLEETGAVGVGGRLRHEGTDAAGRAIGAAMVSPFGMASPFRFGSSRRDVDTIGHPMYRRHVFDDVGLFDESLERNSDYEMNWRIREAGGRLVFEPSIETVYRPRPSLTHLARQFWWYGWWKATVLRRHPRSLRARHAVPPLAVIAMATSPLLARTRWGRRSLALGGSGYAVAIVVATAAAHPRRRGADIRTLALAFPTMHACWGAGLLAGSAGQLRRARR